MAKQFPVNSRRKNPYGSYRFQVFFGTSHTPVAGVQKCTSLKRSSDVIEYKQAGSGIALQGLGRTKYEPVTISRGVTFDADFQSWADAAQVLDTGSPTNTLANLRKDIRIELLNEVGQSVMRYTLYNCWVSEFQALPDLDAGATAVAIETIKIVHEGWERDMSLTELLET